MTTEAQIQANRADARKSTGLRLRSDRVSGIWVRDGTATPSAPVPWASAPNKPNFGHGKTKDKWFAAKELWLSGPAKSTEKTKPIPAGPGDPPSPMPRRLGKTNPIARSGAPRRCPATPGGTRPGGRETRVKCAKQSQFRPRRQERQRLGGKGLMVNRTFDRPRQNKPNSGEV